MAESIREHVRGFRERIGQFIKLSQHADDSEIKSEYIKLVREFHPDYIYEQVRLFQKNIVLDSVYKDEFKDAVPENKVLERSQIHKKYCFINEEGIKEYISDKTVYIYKLGKYEYDRALCTSMRPSGGDNEKDGYEIIGHLYKSYKYFKEVRLFQNFSFWNSYLFWNSYFDFGGKTWPLPVFPRACSKTVRV
jgi:hypothetical protein